MFHNGQMHQEVRLLHVVAFLSGSSEVPDEFPNAGRGLRRFIGLKQKFSTRTVNFRFGRRARVGRPAGL